MKITVSVESTNDLSKSLIEENGISVVPYHVTLGNDTYKDGEITTAEIFKFVDESGILPKTNAINEFEYTEYFEGLKKDCDAIVHICLSSDLSSSYANALRAGNSLKDVYVIDSKSLSTGIGLLALYACDLVKEGFDAATVAKKVEDRKRELQVSFVVERLDYLYKGGRCNSLQLFGANLFKLRPRIVVSDGKMDADKKYRGKMGKVVAKYCEDTLEEFNTPDLGRVFITYTSATEDMVAAARDALVNRGFKNIYETRAGCTIASHCGGNTLGILYFNDGAKRD